MEGKRMAALSVVECVAPNSRGRRTGKFVLAILLATGSAALVSAPASATTQIINVTVTTVSIYTGSSGSTGAQVYFSPAVQGPIEGCTYSQGNIVWIDFASTIQPDGKSLYATVLTALLAGRTVTFGVVGCGNGGQLAAVYRIDVGS
jgi:hypothetical protein